MLRTLSKWGAGSVAGSPKQCCWLTDCPTWMSGSQVREGVRPMWMLTRKTGNMWPFLQSGHGCRGAKPPKIGTSKGPNIHES